MTGLHKPFPGMQFVISAVFLLCTLGATVAPAQAAPYLWFFSANGLREILSIDPGLGHTALNSSRTFVAGDDVALRGNGWAVQARRQYRSVADLQSDRTQIDEPIVVYNPERWEKTPSNEQQDPVAAAQAFASMIHAKGKSVLLVPSCGLMKLVNGRGSPNRACVRRLLVPMARVADFVDFEVQSRETDPGAYSDLVHYAVAQMKAANPNVKVLVQLSTADRPRTDASTDTLLQCARSVADVVDGYWIFVGGDADGPSRADKLVRALLQ